MVSRKLLGNQKLLRSIRCLLCTVLVTLLAGSLHFARPIDSPTWYTSNLLDRIEYQWNPDSPAFARTVARFPEEFVLTPGGTARILRPAYSTAGWMVYTVIHPVAGPFVPSQVVRKVSATIKQANNPSNWQGIGSRSLTVAWLSLIIVNVLFLSSSLYLVYISLRTIFGPLLAATLTLLPATHFDFVRYVYVPHTEIFNVVLPAIFLLVLTRRWVAGRSSVALTLLFGLGQLGKQIIYPVINWLLEPVRTSGAMEGVRRSMLNLGLLLLPSVVYISILGALDLPVYSAEISGHGQVVWMLDYLQTGDFLGLVEEFGGNVVQHLGDLGYVFLGPIGITIGAITLNRPEWSVWKSNLSEGLRLHLLAYLTTGVLFWSCVGLMSPRLAMTHYPVIVVAVGCAVTSMRKSELWVTGAVAANVLLLLGGAYSDFA